MNRTISRYIEKNILYPKVVAETPAKSLGIIVIIPCYNEPDIRSALMSLVTCEKPGCDVEVLVSINAGEKDNNSVKAQNAQSLLQIEGLQKDLPQWLKIYGFIHNELPHKKAGVGLARKIGMDEAVLRFVSIKNEEGVLVCFDADSRCAPNYLIEIEKHFTKKGIGSASIHYEHPVEGVAFEAPIYQSIIQYELHLRYFIYMQRILGLPFAYHTIGSSMACTVSAYCAVGGMNQRKAGEDFYFIHKLVKYGKHSELNSTKVVPSPRISDRVPFGTGKAVGDMLSLEENLYHTYHPDSFREMRPLIQGLRAIYDKKSFDVGLTKGLQEFFKISGAEKELLRILKNTKDFDAFSQKFWHWFDAFLLMKYLHFMRDNYYANISVLDAVNTVEERQFDSAIEALIYYRERDVIS